MQEGSKVSQKRHIVKKVRIWPQVTPVGVKFLTGETRRDQEVPTSSCALIRGQEITH